MFELSHFAQMLVNLLAVGGGFLAGYILTMLFAKFLDRAVLHRQSPKGLHKVVRILGGLAVAILVALIVFGHGQGWNLFGGAENGSGTSEGKDAVHTISTPYTKPETPVSPEPVKPLPTERIRITLLGGGDVKEKKFYRVDDDTMPVNLADVKTAVQRRAAAKPMVEVVFAKQNRLPQDHPAVTLLVQWVRDTAGLTVTFPPDAPVMPVNIVTMDGENVAVADAADGVIVGPTSDVNALYLHRASRCEVGSLPVVSTNVLPESTAFGSIVATSPELLEAAAMRYQLQRQDSNWKLFSLVASVTSFVVLMLAVTAIVFLKTRPEVNPLLERLHAYQRNEGTAAVRLSERNLPRNRRELAAIRDDVAFTTLPAESLQFVNDRLREFDAYTEYAKRFDSPTLSPRELRTIAELNELQRQLENELAPPLKYATDWAETAAVEHFKSWKDEASQIAQASATWVTWYNERSAKAVEVLLGPERSQEWRDSIDRFFEDANTPPWSLLGNRNESQRELQGVSQSMDSVEQARSNWERSQARLLSQRDLYDRMIDIGHWLNRHITVRRY